MINASKILKNYRGDNLCFIPTSDVVEIQSLGANVIIDNISTPRVKDYKYKSIAELVEISNVDFKNTNIISEVLKSISKLSNENENVILNISGPITILSGLIDLSEIAKALKNDRENLDKVLSYLKDFIVEYAIEGVNRGVKIISYADPTGNMDILGSKIYCKLNKDITLEILEELNKKINSRALIHICGRTTSSLLNLKLINLKEIKIDNDITYGEALLRLHNEKISMIGQNCIKDTRKNCKGKILYKIENL